MGSFGLYKDVLACSVAFEVGFDTMFTTNVFETSPSPCMYGITVPFELGDLSVSVWLLLLLLPLLVLFSSKVLACIP